MFHCDGHEYRRTGTYIQLTPTSLNFGNQPVGTKSLSQQITLSNKGSVAANFTSISITGTNSKDFAETNTCRKSVRAGGTCFITVTGWYRNVRRRRPPDRAQDPMFSRPCLFVVSLVTAEFL